VRLGLYRSGVKAILRISDLRRTMKTEVDILIVGAGFAGLGAADAIVQYNQCNMGPRRSFALIDAADRPGGRTKTVERDSGKEVGFLDVGGEYLGRGQSYMMDLVSRYNVCTFPTVIPPDKVSVYQAENRQLTYFLGNYPLTSNVVGALQVIDALTQSTKATLAEPWNALLAGPLDTVTVKQWGEQTFPDDIYAKELLQLAIRCAFSVEWDEISMLYLLFYGATAGSFEAFENVTGDDGGDRIRFAYGTNELVQKMIASFSGDERCAGVHFKQHVRRIEQRDGTPIAVATNGGHVWSAKRVIVAMSPRPSVEIEYDPPPPKRRAMAEAMRMGRTIKGFLLYKTPWWRPRYTGYVLSAKGPAAWILDNTWQDPYTGEIKHPSLMTFIAGAFADQVRNDSKEERQKALESQVKDLFQDERALHPIGYVEGDWQTDPLSHGCPAAVPVPGSLVKFRASIREPHEAVHWAGSESGLEWTGGYMNGAVQSGVRAAGEALNALMAAEGHLDAAQALQALEGTARHLRSSPAPTRLLRRPPARRRGREF
jgi:monoamine oxidase